MTGVNPKALLPFADPEYEQPTGDDLREVLKRVGLPQTHAARLLGVNRRTLRRWLAGEREILYSAWRLLLLVLLVVKLPENPKAPEHDDE